MPGGRRSAQLHTGQIKGNHRRDEKTNSKWPKPSGRTSITNTTPLMPGRYIILFSSDCRPIGILWPKRSHHQNRSNRNFTTCRHLLGQKELLVLDLTSLMVKTVHVCVWSRALAHSCNGQWPNVVGDGRWAGATALNLQTLGWKFPKSISLSPSNFFVWLIVWLTVSYPYRPSLALAPLYLCFCVSI